ncbi:MurR/RpiR family transcriptional regulator [Flavobacterium sp. W21_SRS_FM6]|uniref:MurR/RpiR family transcriptional regulator n=1 Tax=Flavobacterium sp. W21_SRS_FM6 TaxID=3240268 RepID=UPI003F939917
MLTTQSELEHAIESQFASLSKRLQQVARFVLDNPNSIAFGTVASIASTAGVHASTLVRFAHAMGFEGFSDMQKLFKDQLLVSAPDYQTRMQSVLQASSEHDDQCGLSWLRQVSASSAQAMETMCEQVDGLALNQAITLLHQANIIHIQGVRRSFPVATYFSYLLNNIGRKAHLIDSIGQMGKAQCNLMSEGDALFAISFSPYASETLNIALEAKSRGVKLVALTDSPLSPLADQADVCIKIKEAEIHSFRSLNGCMNIIQALMLGLIHHPNNP